MTNQQQGNDKSTNAGQQQRGNNPGVNPNDKTGQSGQHQQSNPGQGQHGGQGQHSQQPGSGKGGQQQ